MHRGFDCKCNMKGYVLNRATIERLAKDYIEANGTDCLASYLAQEISDDNVIIKMYEVWYKQKVEMENRHEKEVNEHKKRLTILVRAEVVIAV